MSKHTPGPWFNTSQDDTPMGEVMDQPLDSGVTLHIGISGPNAKADARLIARAPVMLRLLQLSAHLLSRLEATHNVRVIDDGEGERWDVLEVAEQLDALCAEATGSTHV